ncbi:lactococcin 972 family bacteriocin [Streptomyces sp. H28]|uniref:lactococcin 972 family bacteriocin n=1 Tax=Streptomyces sp. H28 TaxID=2775865 RepID=UPI0017808182|nr:lactococcin 972 family bacteriocin [Streptomyces sp. H28]MBD9733330.1 lactococcin 972 family bacteriocin [Streptomyces sp. H28]
MKVSGRSVALVVAGGFLAISAFAAPANAGSVRVLSAGSVTITTHYKGDGTQPPAELGDPKEWGVVEFRPGSHGAITPKTILNIGGGKWSYGKNLTTDGQYCYSNYYHPKVQHGSTVKVSKWTNKAVASKGKWSYANITAGAAYTCETFYAKY